MDIEFGFDDGLNNFLTGERAVANLAGRSGHELYGAMVFNDGAENFELVDDLAIFLPQICWFSQEQLGKGGYYKADFHAYPGDMRFKCTDDETRVTDDNGQTAVFKTKDLQLALLKCGLAYLQFCKELRKAFTGKWPYAVAYEKAAVIKALNFVELGDEGDELIRLTREAL